jgi:hypothetical protein
LLLSFRLSRYSMQCIPYQQWISVWHDFHCSQMSILLPFSTIEFHWVFTVFNQFWILLIQTILLDKHVCELTNGIHFQIYSQKESLVSVLVEFYGCLIISILNFLQLLFLSQPLFSDIKE